MMTLPLKQYQVEGIEWIRKVKRGLLADEPGLGKTRQAIEAFDGMKVLVVAPRMVIDGGTWQDELDKWAKHPEGFVIAPYTSLNAREQVGARASTTRPVKKLRPEYRGKWDAVVLDESHMVKGRDTLHYWAVRQLSRRCEYFLAMTGTPFPNWAHEIYNLLQFIHVDEGYTGKGGKYGSFWRWAEEWFDTSPTRWSNGMPVAGEMRECSRTPKQWKECMARPVNDPCEHYMKFAADNLGDQYLRRWREDCLDLEPYTEQIIKVPMAATTKTMYNSLKREFYAQYEGHEIIAWNQGSKNNQLMKATTSPWLLTQDGEPRGGKLDRLKFDLSNRTRPTLVFAHYQISVEACAAVARSLGLSVGVVHGGIPSSVRASELASFKSGELDVLVGSLDTLAEGHTLVMADEAIFVERSFKPYRNQQALFRVHRMGQTRPVTIKTYITPNSVDSKKERLLATKTDRQMRVLTAAEFREII
jgi:superfamily II DNA or RNA helicase